MRGEMLTERRIDSRAMLRDDYQYRRRDLLFLGGAWTRSQMAWIFDSVSYGAGIRLSRFSLKGIQNWFHTSEAIDVGPENDSRILPTPAEQDADDVHVDSTLQFRDATSKALVPWLSAELHSHNLIPHVPNLDARLDGLLLLSLGAGENLLRLQSRTQYFILDYLSVVTSFGPQLQHFWDQELIDIGIANRWNAGIDAALALQIHNGERQRFLSFEIRQNSLVGRTAYGESTMFSIRIGIPLGRGPSISRVSYR